MERRANTISQINLQQFPTDRLGNPMRRGYTRYRNNSVKRVLEAAPAVASRDARQLLGSLMIQAGCSRSFTYTRSSLVLTTDPVTWTTDLSTSKLHHDSYIVEDTNILANFIPLPPPLFFYAFFYDSQIWCIDPWVLTTYWYWPQTTSAPGVSQVSVPTVYFLTTNCSVPVYST